MIQISSGECIYIPDEQRLESRSTPDLLYRINTLITRTTFERFFSFRRHKSTHYHATVTSRARAIVHSVARSPRGH